MRISSVSRLKRHEVDLVRCETVDLYVPATYEIVIEGEILPEERALEGPFGEFTGYSAAERAEQPVFRVTAVTHRNDPILIVCCPGVPMSDNQVLLSVTRGAEILDEQRAARGTTLTPFLNLEERRYCLGAAVLFDCTWPVDWPPADIPLRASFDNIYPEELQEHVLKNWRSYGFKQG